MATLTSHFYVKIFLWLWNILCSLYSNTRAVCTTTDNMLSTADILVLLSTADRAINNSILVFLSTADRGIDDIPILLSTDDRGIDNW